jgi:hypothetical protein
MHEPNLPLTHISPFAGQGLDQLLLQAPIDTKTRQQIVLRLWDLDVPNQPSQLSKPRSENLDVFFFYYTQQCVTALHDFGRYVTLRTHQDVVDIAKILKKDITRDEVNTQLLNSQRPTPARNQDEEQLNSSIDLVVRLLLMIEIGRIPNSFSGYRDLLWETGCLREFVSSRFPPATRHHDEHVKFEKIFIARNLGRIAGITIVWTDNLVDHLRLLEYDTKVAVFHHASFLEMLRDR